jgi:D-alanyl-D-alanine carboxypeptidase
MRLKIFFLAFLGTVLWWSHDELRSFIASLFTNPQAAFSLHSEGNTSASQEPVITENRALTATYQPVLKPYAPRLAVPTAHAAVIVDSDSQETLFADNADVHRQIASLTKLMTSIIVVESVKNLDELVTIDEEAVYAEGTRVGCPRSGYCIGERLKIGEQLTVRDLLKAALMNSANDAAIALGKHLGTTQEGFATIMNRRAKELGMNNTHFCTPSGLEPDGHEQECYSSAGDVARMTTQALKYDILWQFMRLEKEEIISHDGRYHHDIFNTDELLGQMPNLVGTKTGFTPLAGRSLLAVARHPESNHRVVAVVLDDQYRWQSVRSMFDWSFQAFDWK